MQRDCVPYDTPSSPHLLLFQTICGQLKSVDRPEDAMKVNDSYLVEVSLLAPSLRVKVSVAREAVCLGFGKEGRSFSCCGVLQELRKDVLMMSKQLAP